MRTSRPAGESCRVTLSWIHSLDAPQWHCGDWSFTDVYTGAIRLEGEFILGFYCHFSAQFNPRSTAFMTLAAAAVFVLLLSARITFAQRCALLNSLGLMRWRSELYSSLKLPLGWLLNYCCRLWLEWDQCAYEREAHCCFIILYMKRPGSFHQDIRNLKVVEFIIIRGEYFRPCFV